MTTASAISAASAWPVSGQECRLDDLVQLVEQPEPTVHRGESERAGVPYYRSTTLDRLVDDGPEARRALRLELAQVLLEGPGILVVTGAVETAAVDQASEIFVDLIEHQRRTGTGGGDHYARPGANDRIWNSLEKLAVAAPDTFINYYRGLAIDLVAEAWLGPGYQVTSQVNVVNPGGEAQRPHRDYHLGFMTEETAADYPAHAHRLSPVLTLQAAVAHGDLSAETGPTKFLPHSQKYGPGYLAWRRPDFIDYFEAKHVQLELAHGDALFFNPAVFHAAGTNRSQTPRMANLLQISSSMGRAMERVDRSRMCAAVYPALQRRIGVDLTEEQAERVVAAAADGYAFPTDLDIDQPTGSLTPPSQAEWMRLALSEGWPTERLVEAIGGPAQRSQT